MRKLFTFFIFLCVTEFSLAQDLTATMKMPEVIPPGTDYIVEVTITKGTINSYIKFTQKLPPRFKATEVESSGGSFTFDDSIVKIIWFFPPAKNEFTFSYKVKVPKDATGNKKIGGKVFYFFNTNREVFVFDKKLITIGNPKDILAAKEKLKNDSIEAANNLVKKMAESIIAKMDTTISPSISKTSDTLSKTKQIPIDTTVASKDTLSKTMVKIADKPAIPKKDTVSAIKLVAKVVPSKDTVLVPPKDTLLSRTVKTATLISSMEPETEDEQKTATAELSYCVQLGAFKGEVPLELANRFFKISARGIKNFKDDNGFTTFTVGNFKTHDEAIPLKNEMLEKGFQGAFIVAVPATKLHATSSKGKSTVTSSKVEKPSPSTTTNTTVTKSNVVTNTPPKVETKPQVVEAVTQKVEVTPKESAVKESSSANRTYRVQIGAFKGEVPLETADKFFKLAAKGIKNLKDNRGFTVYTVGDFKNRDEALVLKNEMIAKGFKDAFIVAFENGEIVK